MRLGLAIVLSTGCGRIAFDAGDAPRTDAPSPDGPPPDTVLICPANYVMVGAGCYRFPTIDEVGIPDLTWLGAEAACEVDGGHLVVFETAAEAGLVAVARPTVSYWIGVSDQIADGDYRWVNGAVAPLPAAFANGEPDPTGGQDCIQFDESVGVFDELCGKPIDDWVCEFDGIPADPSTF